MATAGEERIKNERKNSPSTGEFLLTAVSNDLRQLCATPYSVRYGFLPETIGLVVYGGDHEGSGVIFREAVAYPYSSENRILLPYHSLYADDPYFPEEKPQFR